MKLWRNRQVWLIHERGILDMVMDNEIAKLHEQIRLLRGENEQLKEENQRLKRLWIKRT